MQLGGHPLFNTWLKRTVEESTSKSIEHPQYSGDMELCCEACMLDSRLKDIFCLKKRRSTNCLLQIGQ
ncbi:hypothetical protein Fmac_022182 [Flemingia macrophylla]|uniref:Uncharacterized protein n=1 Tax=Flemingia macrophylla TaxID=520843 RepID=A0ABD1LZ00_9FABA